MLVDLELALVQVFDEGRTQNVLIGASGFRAKGFEPHKQGRFQLYGLHDGPFLRCRRFAFHAVTIRATVVFESPI